MKTYIKNLINLRRELGRSLCALGHAMVIAAIVLLIGGVAHAQTDIPSTITTLSSYQTAAITIGIAVMLWTVGRMLVHKFTRG